MQKSDTPVVKDLVLVGGGHSHVTVLKRFGMKPIPGVRLTLICRDVHTPYSGMLPGLIAGHYGFDDAYIDLGPLARFAQARFYNDEVVGLDPDQKLISCGDRPPVPYDVLSINVGSAPSVEGIQNAGEAVVPVKPIGRFAARWEILKERVLAQKGRAKIGVVGGGAGGVELILAMQYRLHALLRDHGLAIDGIEFHLITEEPDILTTHNPRAAQKFRRVFERRGIQLHTEFRVDEAVEGEIRGRGAAPLALDETLWVTRAGAAPWIRESGLDVDEEGFMRVEDSLRSTSHPDVFGAGDIAAVVNHPRPKSGVFAVRQGPPLARNLRRVLLGREPTPFKPQKEFLSLISTGDKYAIASRGSWAAEGRWVWRWKDWIDRRFIRKFNDLPEMDEDEQVAVPDGLASATVREQLAATPMRCGGCGAKVGATVLSQALARLDPVPRDDVLVGLHAPDDAAIVEVPAGKVLVHTVDSFRAMVEDPYVFGRITANHCLGDIFAMGAEPQTALAIATIPYGLEEKVGDVLDQMMAGASEVLRDSGTALVGGHTGEGAELSLGFAINGLIDRDKVLRKAGMQPGDILILTKALGTGTLLAADMRAKAKGRWVAGAIASMLHSNREAAACLIDHGATACTDVTGFGLLGHLVEMIKLSGVGAELDLAALPLLDGAAEMVAAGITSSLQPQNLRLRRAIADLEEAAADPRFPLLFDPQTAGGLLASVPAEKAESCLAMLQSLGYDRAAIIGRVGPSGVDAGEINVTV